MHHFMELIAEVEGAVSPSVPAMPIDSLELLRAKKLREEQAAAAAAAAAVGPVHTATDRHDENRDNAAPRVAHFVPLFNIGRRADPEPPKPDRPLKPRVFGMFRRRRSEDLSPTPRSPKSPTPPSPSTQENPPKDKTLYRELLELRDDFDINNFDLTEDKWFKDEIDAQNQANIPNGDVQQEEPPPSYDKLETRLRLSPPPEKHHKPELDRLPDLKDDQEGPDNLQLELYDELLAIELHNRELRLMGTKT